MQLRIEPAGFSTSAIHGRNWRIVSGRIVGALRRARGPTT
jgi:hypothetical protein